MTDQVEPESEVERTLGTLASLNPAYVLDHTDAPAAPITIDDIYRTHRMQMVRLAILLVDDMASAEDVVQEAFAGLYRNWGGLRDRNAAIGYLRTAVVNGSQIDAAPPADRARLRAAGPRHGAVGRVLGDALHGASGGGHRLGRPGAPTARSVGAAGTTAAFPRPRSPRPPGCPRAPSNRPPAGRWRNSETSCASRTHDRTPAQPAPFRTTPADGGAADSRAEQVLSQALRVMAGGGKAPEQPSGSGDSSTAAVDHRPIDPAGRHRRSADRYLRRIPLAVALIGTRATAGIAYFRPRRRPDRGLPLIQWSAAQRGRIVDWPGSSR